MISISKEKKWKYLSFALMGILAAAVMTQPQAFAVSDTQLKQKFDEIWIAIDGLITKTDNLELGQQNAVEEIEDVITRVEALEARVEQESQDTKQALQELADRLEEADAGLESKAEETRLDLEDLQLQVADLSENVSTLEGRVTNLELAISGDKTCSDGLDNNANQLIDSADPSCSQDSTPGIED